MDARRKQDAPSPAWQAARSLFSSEPRWRRALLDQIAPQRHDVTLHVPCGDGALIVPIAQAAVGAVVMGLDPNRAALDRARARAEAAQVRIELIHGEGADIAAYVNELAPSKIILELRLSDLLRGGGQALCDAAHKALRNGGEIHVAAFGLAPLAGPLPIPDVRDQLRHAGFVGVHETGRYASAAGPVRLLKGRAA